MSDYQAKQDTTFRQSHTTTKTSPSEQDEAEAKKDDARKAKNRAAAKKKRAAEKKKDEPATADDATKSVSVTISAIHSDVLDSLRQSTSRPDYVSAVVARHLEAANPVGSVTEDDELPGNEREVKSPVFRV